MCCFNRAGHGWDVKSVDWHPQKSLLVSAKDNLVKLWDAKTGKELSTLHGHKNTVLSVKWNSNGNWVITASRDQTIKLYDIRTLQELESYRGHRKEVTALAWHPFHEELFVSGSYDGSIIHWLVGHEIPQAEVANAHESSVWDLAWHPMGHILCSGSNDHTTKFWCRNRPGDSLRDCRQAIPHSQGNPGDSSAPSGGRASSTALSTDGPVTPGPFTGGGPVRGEGAIPGVGMAMPMPQAPCDTVVAAPALQAVLGVMTPNTVPINPPPPNTPYPAASQSSLQQQQQQQQHQQQMQQQQSHQQMQQQQQVQQQQMQSMHGLAGQTLQVAPAFPQQPPGLPPHLMPQSVLPMPPGAAPPPPAPNAGPFVQGQPPMRQMMGPSPPLGLPPMLAGPNLGGVQMAMGTPAPFGAGPQRPSGMGPSVSSPFGTSIAQPMPGPMVTSPATNTFQGTGPPVMMDVRAHGMNVGLAMGMAMGMPPHPHGPGPPHS
ncbi:hypothetical protein Mapa_016943 [Marchantia paleacea]|nr:hypothetical protein Mapa_016943 [Marchantia paleacea]